MSSTTSDGPLMDAILRHDAERGGTTALEWGSTGCIRTLRYDELPGAIDRVARDLARLGPGPFAILAENGPDAVLADLALRDSTSFVPLPTFFSDAQLGHALVTARVEVVLTDDPVRVRRVLAGCLGLQVAAQIPIGALPGLTSLSLSYRFSKSPSVAPAWTAGTPVRMTFTSGTTGTPKGVRLTAHAEDLVSASLAVAMRALPGERHLCVHPFPVLLETVGGVYRSLRSGGTVVIRSAGETGVKDAAASDGGRLLAALAREQISVAILVPELLKDLVKEIERGREAPRHLRFLGVGGARVSVAVLERAARIGLPAFEGYGLTEACSVVCLNTEDEHQLGSVGRPLPHAEVTIAADGEVVVRGALFHGYHGEALPAPDETFMTGDFGDLDRDGFLHLQGRKSDVICTSYGRNVSARWLEQVLTDNTPFEYARVFGDGLPGPVAELYGPRDHATARRALEQIHETLPVYARIRSFSLIQTARAPRPDQPSHFLPSDHAEA